MPVQCVCPQCGTVFDSALGRFNRARKINAPLYCGKECAGAARRLKNPQTEAERRAAKAKYDHKYRLRNPEELKQKKAAYFQYTYNPEKAKEVRAKRMPLHLEYCRRPEYRAWKREYDKAYRAARDFGEFAEAALMLRNLEQEIEERAGEEVNLDKAREKSNERND